MRNAFLEELTSLMETDSSIMLLTADLGFNVFEEIECRFPSQYLNVGIAEQNMIGVATGLALEGYKIFAYSIGNFATQRCLEQLRNDVCYHQLNVNIVISGGGFSYGPLGMSHHATEDLAIMRTLPHTTVIAPSSPWEARMATRQLLQHSSVGYLRLDKSQIEFRPGNNSMFSIGHAITVRDGTDITIISTGGITREALRAAEILEEQNTSVRVISMHTIKPIDSRSVINAIKETGGLVVLEEHVKNGGLGDAVMQVCMTNGCHPGNFLHIGIDNEFSSIVGSQDYMRKHYQMDAASIAKKILVSFNNE